MFSCRKYHFLSVGMFIGDILKHNSELQWLCIGRILENMLQTLSHLLLCFTSVNDNV